MSLSRLCSVLACVYLFNLPLPAESGWSPWSDTVCYQPSNSTLCKARQQRNCVCTQLPTCPCYSRMYKTMYPPKSYEYCTKNCEAFGTWCTWSHWYQSERSSCRVLVVERKRRCCAENTHVSVDEKRCEKDGVPGSTQSRLHYVYNCTTNPMGRLAGVFGTVFAIVCVLTVVIILRLRARRRHLRIMAQRNRSAEGQGNANDAPYIISDSSHEPYGNVRGPVMPPSYDEVQPLPPPPPYELTVTPPEASAPPSSALGKSEA